MFLAAGSVRPGRNLSRKDTSFYEKGNQVAGSLLTGRKQCESDLGELLFIPQPEQAVGFVHGWLVGWLPSCSGQRGPHRLGRQRRWPGRAVGPHEGKGPCGQ